MAHEALEKFDDPDLPAPSLLVSNAYLQPFEKNEHRLRRRSWVLDSGAFTAAELKKHFFLSDYVDTVKRLVDQHQDLVEVFALDVIGDWRATVNNARRMERAGVHSIPTAHQGCPIEVVRQLARDYPKIAIGGIVGQKGVNEWINEVFQAVWPCRIHLFGSIKDSTLRAYPFDSADASSWQQVPLRYGRWSGFGFQYLPGVRGDDANLAVQITAMLRLEEELTSRWRRELEPLRKRCPLPPVVR